MRQSRLQRNVFLTLFIMSICLTILVFNTIFAEEYEANETVEVSNVLQANSSDKIEQIGRQDNLNFREEEIQLKQEEVKPIEEKKNIAITSIKKDAPESSKIVYLTFDDGPTYDNTPAILDVLSKENVKATFFVIGSMAEKNTEILKRQKAEGHVIANHTYSHNYNYIYSSPENYLEDLKKAEGVITSIIGDYNKTLTRFPAGSFGRQAYITAVENAGYKYFDWNSLNGDAEGKSRSAEELVNRAQETSLNKNKLIMLMHDAPGKTTTVQAMSKIIQNLKAQGYEFGVLQ